jgi:hypothetical protein
MTAPNPVLSTLKYFKNEYLDHIVHKRCAAGVCNIQAPDPSDSPSPASPFEVLA